MTTNLRYAIVAALSIGLAAGAVDLGAQGRGGSTGRQGGVAELRGDRRGGPPAGRGLRRLTPAEERQIQLAVGRAVRAQLGLNDERMLRLRTIDSSYALQRGALDREEAQLRGSLQRALDGAPGGPAIAELLDRLVVGIPQEHVDLDRAEQRELSAVLDPVQRAKFLAIRENVRRQLEMRLRMPPPPSRP